MDTDEFDDILADAVHVLRSYKHHGVVGCIKDARAHYHKLEANYRKLAEREKALTEALSDFLFGIDDDCGDEDCCECAPYRKARAALALHKEDA